MKKIKKFIFIGIIMVFFTMFVYAFYKVEVDNAMPKIAILSEKIAIDDHTEIIFIDNKGDIYKYIPHEKKFVTKKWVKSYEDGEIYNTIKVGEVDKDELYKQYKNIKRSSLIPFDTLHGSILYDKYSIGIVTPDYYWYGVCYTEDGIKLIPLYMYSNAEGYRSYLWTTKKVTEWFGNYVKVERK